MGYQTDFNGRFDLDKSLTPQHSAYLFAFAGTRRMKRDAAKAELLDDPLRIAVELPIGIEGEYFVGDGKDFGQNSTPDVLAYNDPPSTQPGLWCQSVPTEDDDGIEWDGGEKFYDYVEWMEYFVANFLKPWGYVLNGFVEWDGEEHGDIGIIEVRDNIVTSKLGRVIYE